MKLFTRSLWVGASIASALSLSACGGSDTDDRFDVADPAVRFVHASPFAPNVSLYRDDVAQDGASNVPYKFASDYFDVSGSAARWSIKTAIGSIVLGEETINPSRGNKYTFVVLPSSIAENSIYVIKDFYNKSLISNRAKLRIMNASFNANNVDLYLNALNTDISAVGISPVIAATAYKTSGPASGNDSLDIDNGNYQIIVTTGGTKTVLFKGAINIEKNKDILLLIVPGSFIPSDIKVLMKIEGTPGTAEVPAS